MAGGDKRGHEPHVTCFTVSLCAVTAQKMLERPCPKPPTKITSRQEGTSTSKLVPYSPSEKPTENEMENKCQKCSVLKLSGIEHQFQLRKYLSFLSVMCNLLTLKQY